MGSDASHLQFSQQTWQTVSDQAKQCLWQKEFCSEQSRVDNLRCVHFEDESERHYGRQLWYFEANGIDPVGRRHALYGALEFSLQYGLLENCQAALFEDPEDRRRFLMAMTMPHDARVWAHPATRLWVRMAILAVVIVGCGWLMILVRHLMGSQ